jgi:hypothetical protein
MFFLIKLKVIVLGGGYDTRLIQLCLDDSGDHAWELDLLEVVESKARLLQQLYQRSSSAAVGGWINDIWKAEEKVTEEETNENPRKKAFSHDMTKKG